MANKYPVVLLHGMFGYGQQQVTNSVLPYFGLYKADIRKLYEEEFGVKCVAPSMGPFTSAWNRACELYAQLFGGTVDYGKAHSKKYGMERFGETYEALLPEWGTLDENGDLIKINIIGHSFGGVSGRMLTELMVNGSKEEQDATDPEQLSGLFKGGHKGWVHSITTLASPHNGMTSVEGSVGVAMRHICRGICDVFNVVDATPARGIYDLGLSMYGLAPELKNFKAKDAAFKDYMFENKDTIVYDLTLEGAKALNDKLPTQEDVYYFSYRGGRTFGLGENEIPSPLSFPILSVLGFFMGTQPKSVLPEGDLDWRKNDMVINTKSAEAPAGAPRKDSLSGLAPDNYKPGIWHVFPAELKDHMSYCGWADPKSEYIKFYKQIYRTISSDPTVE